MKKLTIGVLKLPTEVTHYIVPSKEPAAYLQAKVCRNFSGEAENRKTNQEHSVRSVLSARSLCASALFCYFFFICLVRGSMGSCGPGPFVVPSDMLASRPFFPPHIPLVALSLCVLLPCCFRRLFIFVGENASVQATNNTDYLLLPSDAVSVFLDNSFASKTSMAFNSPGETFQTFLGMDPTIKASKKALLGRGGGVLDIMHDRSRMTLLALVI